MGINIFYHFYNQIIASLFYQCVCPIYLINSITQRSVPFVFPTVVCHKRRYDNQYYGALGLFKVEANYIVYQFYLYSNNTFIHSMISAATYPV